MSANGQLTWQNVSIALGDLLPWADNPRFLTKAQAQRLLNSWKQLGQFQTVAIGPRDAEGKSPVYDGHQRLSALLTLYNAEYQIDARQASRPLDDDERRALTLAANLQTGAWDWDKLAAWPEAQLTEWGMDSAQKSIWDNDALNLRLMIESNSLVPEFKEYDESAVDGVETVECPYCGKTFPK